jgi:magnesium-transporting ATPase (P-type)
MLGAGELPSDFRAHVDEFTRRGCRVIVVAGRALDAEADVVAAEAGLFLGISGKCAISFSDAIKHRALIESNLQLYGAVILHNALKEVPRTGVVAHTTYSGFLSF